MSERFFLAATGATADAAGSRVLWAGRCAVAEYAFENPGSLPRWALPEETEVVVTEERVVYRDSSTGATGELRWPFPQHLRVQPGDRNTGRSATVTQIQLVCVGSGGAFPALVFAGGDLATVSDADRLANVLRQAIARYRVDHAAELGIPAPKARMLSRLVIGPEFSNYQGGEGQTVSLLGATSVSEPPPPAPAPAVYHEEPIPEPYQPSHPASGSAPAVSHGPRAHPDQASGYTPYAAPMAGRAEFGASPPQVLRPGFDEVARSRPARPADEVTLRGGPDLEARAADLAARVASLVAGGGSHDRTASDRANLSSLLSGAQESLDRAEQVRRTAARLAGNSARGRGVAPRNPADDEMGSTRNG
jgi:hypothetical protein